MNKYYPVIFVLLSIFILSSCAWMGEDKSGVPFIALNNQSDETVMLIYKFDYPDTMLYHTYSLIAWDDLPIPPHKKRVANCALTREEVFSLNPIVQIFVVDYKKRYNSKLPEEERNAYLRRYELTREWLEEHDWTVTYP